MAAFAAFATDTDVRLTFFPNGCYRSWEENADVAAPAGRLRAGRPRQPHLVPPRPHHARRRRGGRGDRPQPRLPADHVRRRDSPFFRPPFGSHDERTDRIAADLGHPTIAMWNGTLERLPGAHRRPSSGGRPRVVRRRRRSSWATPTSATVTTVYGELLELIAGAASCARSRSPTSGRPPPAVPGRVGERRPSRRLTPTCDRPGLREAVRRDRRRGRRNGCRSR